LAISLGLRIFSPEHEGAIGAFLRVGVVMGALWFAVPVRGAEVAWEKMMPILVGGIVLIALFKRVILVALPIAVGVGAIAYFLRPRKKNKPGPPYSPH